MALNLNNNYFPALNGTLNEIQNAVNTPLVYVGILTQTGTNNPVVTIIRNDFDVVWIYDRLGYFYGIASGIDFEKAIVTGLDFTFSEDDRFGDVRLIVSETNQYNSNGDCIIGVSSFEVQQGSSKFTRTPVDGVHLSVYLKIEVYN